MSAAACVLFIGLRYDLAEHEVAGCEERSDPRLIAARRQGLASYWGRFIGSARHVLLVGTKLSVVGPEDQLAARFPADYLAATIEQTCAHLVLAGLDGDVALHVEFHDG